MSQITYQLIAVIILGFNCFIYGFTALVPATTMVLFTSNSTTLDRPMTQMEGSLMASVMCIGAVIGTPLTGFLLDYLGRKRTSISIAIIPVLTWALLVFTNRVEVVITTIFILGLSGSIFLVVPVYVSEIAQDSIRGVLSSGTMLCTGMGMLVMFLLGGLLEYKTISYIGLTGSTVGLVLLGVLKESPTLLMKKGLEDEAAKALAFYRNSKTNSKVVMQEIDNIRRALAPDLQAIKPEEEKFTAEHEIIAPGEKLSAWQFFKKSRSTRRAFLVVITIMTASIFQGMPIVQLYSIQLFGEVVPREVLSPNWCSALLSTVSLLTGSVAGCLTDVTGRRALLIYSCISAGFCSLALGTQVHMHWAPQWTTALLMYILCVAYTFGSGTVPFVLLGELFLPEVKSILSMICIQLNWFNSFVALFLFNPVVSSIGLGPVFYFFSIVSFSTAVFAYIFLPETKGLTVDMIQNLLVKRR